MGLSPIGIPVEISISVIQLPYPSHPGFAWRKHETRPPASSTPLTRHLFIFKGMCRAIAREAESINKEIIHISQQA
jgi:hypothetical protein